MLSFVLVVIFCVAIFIFLRHLKQEISDVSQAIYDINSKPIVINDFRILKPIAQAVVALSLKLDKKDKQRRQYAARLKLQNKQNTEVIEAIGHEFKNPVAALMGYTQTLLEDKDIDPKVAAKFLEKIYNNAQNISNMVDRLALAAKLESNMITPSIAKVDIAKSIDEAIAQIKGKYVKAIIDTKISSEYVNADKTMVMLILTNLLDNACKYGGLHVIVETSATQTEVLVSIKDKGLGIEKDDLEKLTQKFYRVRQNGWDNSLGLGLAIVEYLLKLHGHGLAIQSELGHGSTFSFSLNKA